MNVLVVEPDMLTGKTLLGYLEHVGYSVRLRQGAAEGIAALDEQPADAIILELNLPGHNGLEFLYEMRSYTDWQDVPVVIHSHTPPAKLLQSLAYKELGISRYLYKPETSLAELDQSLTNLSVV